MKGIVGRGTAGAMAGAIHGPPHTESHLGQLGLGLQRGQGEGSIWRGQQGLDPRGVAKQTSDDSGHIFR